MSLLLLARDVHQDMQIQMQKPLGPHPHLKLLNTSRDNCIALRLKRRELLCSLPREGPCSPREGTVASAR